MNYLKCFKPSGGVSVSRTGETFFGESMFSWALVELPSCISGNSLKDSRSSTEGSILKARLLLKNHKKYLGSTQSDT